VPKTGVFRAKACRFVHVRLMLVGANFFVVPAGRHFPLFYPLSSKYRVIRQHKTAEDNLLFRRKQQQIYPFIQDFLALRVLHRPPYWRNPNLKPVGKGFGFLVYIEQIRELL
jgi:hypothetical protein